MRIHLVKSTFGFLLGCFGIVALIGSAQAGILLGGGDESDPAGYVNKFNTKGALPNGFIQGGPALVEPQAVARGPNGSIYVLEGDGGSATMVYRYNGTSGQFIENFVTKADAASDPSGMVFGPDGNLYIGVNETTGASYGEGGAVLKFNGTTGASMGTFIANGAGGTGVGATDRLGETKALVFGPDGNLYISNSNSSFNENVLKFDGTTGAYIPGTGGAAFIPEGSNGLNDITGMVFGSDGNLYVSNEGSNGVLRYNGTTGAFIDVFVPDGSGGVQEPQGIAFGNDGLLYLVDGDGEAVYRYNKSSGAFVDTFVASNVTNHDARALILIFEEAAIPALGISAIVGIGVLLAALGAFLLRRRLRATA